MSAIGTYSRARLPDDLLRADDIDIDQVDVQDLQSNLFMVNGLLEDGKAQEEPLAESQADARPEYLLSSGASHSFVSNGLLEDGGDVLCRNPSPGRFNGSSCIPSGTLMANSMTQDGESESSQPFSLCHRQREFASTGLLDETGKCGTHFEIEETHTDSQESLLSLSQILHANGQPRDELTISGGTHPTKGSALFVSVTATTFDGKTIVFKKRSKTKSRATTEGQRFDNLLETSVHKLKDQLSEATAAGLLGSEAGPSTSNTVKTVDHELWVDRYRPSRFIDLLGDERVHRDTLSWLKEWDFCVFGKRKSLTRQAKPQPGRDSHSENWYEDVYHRPLEKILLLAGPAGYGKTTLAHVVARQAGYEVTEINASDSRSGQVIDDRVRPTLETGSVVGSKMPVCLVIDEIDGATGAGENSSSFIHKLIGLTFDNARKKGRRDKSKATIRPLLRPIICICNDLYASSLTKLRQHARIIRFTRPADVYLTKRLRSICDTEGLRAESRALTTLVGLAKGDMRGCLNTLQFIKTRQQEVTEAVIRTATSGMKEGDSSFSSVMNGLFAPLAKKRVKELGMTDFEETRYVSRLSMGIDATGSIDKVASGCFEHYASLRHYEASLARHERGANWLVVFDTLSSAMHSKREYGLMPYLSYTLVPFFPLFNERGGPKVDRTKADWDALMKMRMNEEIYKSLAKCVQSSAGQCCAGLRYFLSNEIMQLELAPFLNRIISPPMRPINNQITKPQERALLARLVDIMVALELRFVQEKTEDGQLIYRLEPPIDAFVTYDGKRAPDIAVQRYATRHVIAGEIDAQSIARHAEIIERSKAKSFDMFKSSRNVNDASVGSTGMTGHSSLLGKRKSETADVADKPPVDFFGRPITTVASVPNSKRRKQPSLTTECPSTGEKFKVSYRFNEGNSAAVRKPVRMISLL